MYRLPLTWYPRRGPRPHREGLFSIQYYKYYQYYLDQNFSIH